MVVVKQVGGLAFLMLLSFPFLLIIKRRFCLLGAVMTNNRWEAEGEQDSFVIHPRFR